jgi:hypothetical protein
MCRETIQWSQISIKVMEISSEHTECERDTTACKDKWAILLVDYKKIYDHHKGTGTSSYWSMSGLERGLVHLPQNFL